MRIGFIGAGKAGFTLGKYFAENGLPVSGYYSRNPDSAKEASAFTGTNCYKTIGELVKASDMIFLTVPDGAIKDVFVSIEKESVKNKIICHCSGALSAAIFSETDQTNVFGYSIHPLFAISSKYEAFKEISKAFFTIEGHPQYLQKMKFMLESLGNPVQIISNENKVKYHAAAVFASNLVEALVFMGEQLLMQCGFSDEDAKAALMPLFINNCENIGRYGVQKALTGPVERGDLQTVKKHMEALNGNYKQVYRLLSESLTELANKKNDLRDYKAMDAFLKGMDDKL